MNVNVYQHFRKEEHPFVEQVNDWITQVDENYAPVLTNFLDPRQAHIVKTMVGQNQGISLEMFGGYQHAERVRMMLSPHYYEVKEEDFELGLVEINYPSKFTKLAHGMILGSLMGTGLKREFSGDIITDECHWQFFIQKDKLNYLQVQLDRIGSVKVTLTEVSLANILVSRDNWQLEQVTVSSLRLDTLISTVFKISRQQAKIIIDVGKVKVNWAETNKLDYGLEQFDVISVRGFGRIQIQKIMGKTKKDKLRLEIQVLKK